jgi:hypothetical protein
MALAMDLKMNRHVRIRQEGAYMYVVFETVWRILLVSTDGSPQAWNDETMMRMVQMMTKARTRVFGSFKQGLFHETQERESWTVSDGIGKGMTAIVVVGFAFPQPICGVSSMRWMGFSQ